MDGGGSNVGAVEYVTVAFRGLLRGLLQLISYSLSLRRAMPFHVIPGPLLRLKNPSNGRMPLPCHN